MNSNPRLTKHLVIMTVIMATGFVSGHVYNAFAQDDIPAVESTSQLVALIAVVFGAGLRTVLPFLKAKSELAKAAAKENKTLVPLTFDSKFAATFGFSVIAAIMTAFTGFAGLDVSGAASLLGVFIIATVYGWGLNSIINSITE